MEHCSASLRICDIAEYLNIPAINLSKNFKNDTGITLKKYIEDKVIQKAEEALLITDKTIKEIAYDYNLMTNFIFQDILKILPEYLQVKQEKKQYL
jgi:AraC-like DNA-binding protein